MQRPLTVHSLFFLALVLVLALTSTGCNTTHGFGKDVEKVGEKIQKGAD